MSTSLTLTTPDDWHLHVRDGAALAAVLPATARQFARAIIMPNLKRRCARWPRQRRIASAFLRLFHVTQMRARPSSR